MGDVRLRGKIWSIRYYRNGKRYEESSGSTKKKVATDLLKVREGKIAEGVPITARIGQLRFEEAAADVINDYQANNKRSIAELKRRIDKHLSPFFGGRRMASITTADVRAFITHRQSMTTVERKAYELKGTNGAVIRVPNQVRTIDRVSNAEINRELTILRRIFNLAVQAGKLLHRPHVPLLDENNTRTGFFEPEQFTSVLSHLPTALQPVIEFAYITGWRIDSEVLTLQWSQVDFAGREIRLDAGKTKNGDGRVFPLTDDLTELLRAQHQQHLALKKSGVICPWIFFRMVADGRGGKKTPKPITSFNKAWKNACVDSGCPGRIPHDLRRTAVRNMIRRGVPERVAMTLTGHKTRSIFERYNIVSEGDLRLAASQLSGLTGNNQGSRALGNRPSV